MHACESLPAAPRERFRLRIWAGAMLACGAAVPVAAAAQLAPATAGRDTLIRLDTLNARALRLPLPAARAPYAVTTLGEREVRRAKPGIALDEALRAVPGVQVDNRFNYAVGERVSIRGFGARAQFGVRGVRVLLDGIPATLPDGQTTLNQVDMGALASAAVIRGPAAALYGNASGGVILLTSAPPPPVPYGATYQASAGADGLLRLRASAGGTLGRLRYQAGLTRLRYGGYREQQSASNLLGMARVQASGAYGEAALVLHTVNYDAENPGSLSDSLLRVDRRQVAFVNRRDRTGEAGRHRELGATWDRRLGALTLSASAYGQARALDNPIPNRVIALTRRAGGGTFVLRSDAPAARLRWAVGTEAALQRDDRRDYTNLAGERGTLVLDQLERVRVTSGFARAAAALGDGGAELMAALRYDAFRSSARDRLPATPTNPDDSGARRMTAWSPTAGLSLPLIGGAVRAYANVASAFETPTTTELANRPDGAGGFNPTLRPQRTRSLEAGLKGRLGAAASLDVAVYRARVADALIPTRCRTRPGASSSATPAPRRTRGSRSAWRGRRAPGYSPGSPTAGRMRALPPTA